MPDQLYPYQILTLAPLKMIGHSMEMTLAENKTFQLWNKFRTVQHTIPNASADLYSIQLYPSKFDFTFANPQEKFEKWAAVKAPDFLSVPPGMQTLLIPAGLYAVFQYKGLSTDPRIFHSIFSQWLPHSSEYMLDQRPHFEILGSRYNNNDPNSEEEIWIPIRAKGSLS